jgi:hypothetical protein
VRLPVDPPARMDHGSLFGDPCRFLLRHVTTSTCALSSEKIRLMRT